MLIYIMHDSATLCLFPSWTTTWRRRRCLHGDERDVMLPVRAHVHPSMTSRGALRERAWPCWLVVTGQEIPSEKPLSSYTEKVLLLRLEGLVYCVGLLTNCSWKTEEYYKWWAFSESVSRTVFLNNIIVCCRTNMPSFLLNKYLILNTFLYFGKKEIIIRDRLQLKFLF